MYNNLNRSNSEVLISIITATYNRKEVLSQSIDSSLLFSRDSNINVEIIVVDDGSEDGTTDYVNEVYSNELRLHTIRLVTVTQNYGVTFAKQAGVDVAKGQWIIFMDSDDYFVESSAIQVVESLVECSESTPIVFFRCIDSNTRQLIGRELDEETFLSARSLLIHGTPGECLPAVRRSAMLKFPYDAKLRGHELISYVHIALNLGDVLISKVIARIYNSDEGGDRLSTKKRIKKRACLLALGNYSICKSFWRIMGLRSFSYVGRAIYYGLICFINKIHSD